MEFDSGTKIAKVDEFVDATIFEDFLPRFKAAMAKIA